MFYSVLVFSLLFFVCLFVVLVFCNRIMMMMIDDDGQGDGGRAFLRESCLYHLSPPILASPM